MILDAIKYIYRLTLIPCVISVFDADEHRIISKEGVKILEKNRKTYTLEDYYNEH